MFQLRLEIVHANLPLGKLGKLRPEEGRGCLPEAPQQWYGVPCTSQDAKQGVSTLFISGGRAGTAWALDCPSPRNSDT